MLYYYISKCGDLRHAPQSNNYFHNVNITVLHIVTMRNGIMYDSMVAEERGFNCLAGASNVFVVSDDIQIPVHKISLRIQNGIFWRKGDDDYGIAEPPTIGIGIRFEKLDRVDELLEKTQKGISGDDDYVRWKILGKDGIAIEIKIISVPVFFSASDIIYVNALWAEGFERLMKILPKTHLFPELIKLQK